MQLERLHPKMYLAEMGLTDRHALCALAFLFHALLYPLTSAVAFLSKKTCSNLVTDAELMTAFSSRTPPFPPPRNAEQKNILQWIKSENRMRH